jgi:hypothetical protein
MGHKLWNNTARNCVTVSKFIKTYAISVPDTQPVLYSYFFLQRVSKKIYCKYLPASYTQDGYQKKTGMFSCKVYDISAPL